MHANESHAGNHDKRMYSAIYGHNTNIGMRTPLEKWIRINATISPAPAMKKKR